MPKFREWRSRPSYHGAGINLKSSRCVSCRNWFQQWSPQDKTCPACNSEAKFSSSIDDEAFHTANHSAFFDSSPRPNKIYSAEGMLESGFGNSLLWQQKSTPDTRKCCTGCQTGTNKDSRFPNQKHTLDALPSDDDDVATVCIELDNEPLDKSHQRNQLFARHEIRNREFFRAPGNEYYSKQSIGTQTDTANALPSRRDVSVQVQLIPNFVCELVEDHKESSRSLLLKGRRKEDVERLFEEEIEALSTDPSVLDFKSSRASITNEEKLLKSKFIAEKLRLERKWKNRVSKNGEEKRIVNALNVSRDEYRALKDKVQAIDELVLHFRQRLQQYEDQLAATNQKLLNETDKELAEHLKTSLMKHENRVAQVKLELNQRIQERARLSEELKDAEQYLRDQEDTYRLWRENLKKQQDQKVASVGVTALWDEISFLKSRKENAERRVATKILKILELQEALLTFKYQHSLSAIQGERKYYMKLFLEMNQPKEALKM